MARIFLNISLIYIIDITSKIDLTRDAGDRLTSSIRRR